MRLITGTSRKIRKLYEAVRREQQGISESSDAVTSESALRDAGVDETLIAKQLKEQLEAKQPRWNPKKETFDLFADYDARLAALREAAKILGYDSEREDKSRAPVLIDFTNSWVTHAREARGLKQSKADSKMSQTASEGFANKSDGRERSER